MPGDAALPPQCMDMLALLALFNSLRQRAPLPVVTNAFSFPSRVDRPVGVRQGESVKRVSLAIWLVEVCDGTAQVVRAAAKEFVR